MTTDSTNSDGQENESTDGIGDENSSGDLNTADDSSKASDNLKRDLAEERKRRQQAEKALKAEQQKSLSESERVVAERDELKDANEQLSSENIKLKLALQLKLPWSVAKRIQGKTEEEMREDANELLREFKPKEEEKEKSNGGTGRKPPANDGKRTGDSGKPGMSELLRTYVKGR